MRKRITLIVVFSLIGLLLFGGLTSFIAFKVIKKVKRNVEVKNANVEVVLVDELVMEFNSERFVSDYIKSINGEIIDNYQIKNKELGKQTIKFKFINDEGVKLDYEFDIDVVDTKKPVVWLGSSYSIKVGSDDTLLNTILCGDNYDSNPKCEIIGEYDLNTVGKYNLDFKATDSSNNVTEKKFTLNVFKPVTNSGGGGTSTNLLTTPTKEMIENYKTKDTMIGIDVSSWQGDIDFEKVKNDGVEFVMIKVGGTKALEDGYYVDKKFEQNIKNANAAGLKVGIYFYSYAINNEEARKEALWVIKQIKDYKVELPIAFDFEDWTDYNAYHLSFFQLTEMAETFVNTVEENGYQGMIYGSYSYLQSVWEPTKKDIWLAHYANSTNYPGPYKMWQCCDNGVVDGIDGFVDMDVLYLK